MIDEPELPGEEDLPRPLIKRTRWTPSLIWLVPIAAALVGAALLINAWTSKGPRITVSFQSAEGLEVGKTVLKYRDVIIGQVTSITLNSDHTRVLIGADVERSAAALVTSDSQFWVVRPRIGLGGISSLDTLVSGAFIGVGRGSSKSPGEHFVGLEAPPPLAEGLAGKRVILHTDDLGSVSYGAPVYFRRLKVGRVIDQQMDADGAAVQVTLFIDAPYDRLITKSTRFWNVSGIEMALSANGLELHTESLAAVLAGGIAFATAPALQDLDPVVSGAQFNLFKDEAAAMASPNGEPHYVTMRFAQSLRGMSIGAPVEFMGIDIGSVISIDLDYVARDQSFPAVVTAVVYPHRMGRAYERLVGEGVAANDDKMARLLEQLVARGLRAQARPANLLTGQLYVALGFIPGAKQARFDISSRPLDIPTAGGNLDEMQVRLASILRKMDEAPLADIASQVDVDLRDLHDTLQQVNGRVLPGTQRTLDALQHTLGVVDRTLAEDSPTAESLRQTLGEAQRSLNSIRSLTDYLSRHPDALIRGRQVHEVKARAPDSAGEPTK